MARLSFSLQKFLVNGRLRQNSLAIANAIAWCTLRICIVLVLQDWSYAGTGGNWQGMLVVLLAKFKPGTVMAELLLATGDAFLLEHKTTVTVHHRHGSKKN